ncbi:LysR substrate-binding domain-containing protein, partial [[Kitasatospora] papulosa]
PGTGLDVVTLRVDDAQVAAAAVAAGEVDASFRTVTDPGALPPGVRMIHAFDSPLELLVGPAHPLASAREVTPAQLRKHRIWVPGIAPRSEWADFYDQLTTAFDLRIDAVGPHFGDEVLLETLAESPDVATLVGTRDRYAWPAAHDLRRIPVAQPVLAYPLSLVLPAENPHPALGGVVAHLGGLPRPSGRVWRPSWATEPDAARPPGSGHR